MVLGCVADDFTGVSDAAPFLQARGANVIPSNGIPEREDEDILEAQAVVIALETRTCPSGEVVDRSMVAFSWLEAHGTRTLYSKYCSVFDPTESGNIGSILDVVLERQDIPYTLLCPALSEDGRSVKNGKLYVNGVLSEDSPMKDHSLNPMRDSGLKYSMEGRSHCPCFNLGVGELEQGLRPYEKPRHCYLILDYYEERHRRMIVKQYGNPPLLSGKSDLLRMIARTQEPDEERSVLTPPRCTAPIILARSRSRATRAQIRCYESKDGVSLCIHPLRSMQGIQTMEHIRALLEENKDQAASMYTLAPPDEANRIKAKWRELYPSPEHYNEKLLAGTAVCASESGRRGIITVEGETSGTIMQKLEVHTFHIGRSIAPGVPAMYPVEQEGMGLILKSGNFGQEDLFTRAARDI